VVDKDLNNYKKEVKMIMVEKYHLKNNLSKNQYINLLESVLECVSCITNLSIEGNKEEFKSLIESIDSSNSLVEIKGVLDGY